MADQSFNEEVALRLKFEHKINEIHGIHRELLLKVTIDILIYIFFRILKKNINKIGFKALNIFEICA